eukprot:2269081-Rhodomonas_salina.1
MDLEGVLVLTWGMLLPCSGTEGPFSLLPCAGTDFGILLPGRREGHGQEGVAVQEGQAQRAGLRAMHVIPLYYLILTVLLYECYAMPGPELRYIVLRACYATPGTELYGATRGLRDVRTTAAGSWGSGLCPLSGGGFEGFKSPIASRAKSNVGLGLSLALKSGTVKVSCRFESQERALTVGLRSRRLWTLGE